MKKVYLKGTKNQKLLEMKKQFESRVQLLKMKKAKNHKDYFTQ
jgi:hypothetical protein